VLYDMNCYNFSKERKKFRHGHFIKKKKYNLYIFKQINAKHLKYCGYYTYSSVTLSAYASFCPQSVFTGFVWFTVISLITINRSIPNF
jgi:hypothetical protein